MDSGIVLFLMRHRDTSQILPFIAAGVAVELVLNFLTEYSKESYAYTFRQCGNLFCVCAATGWTSDFAIWIRFAVNLFAESGYFLFFMSFVFLMPCTLLMFSFIEFCFTETRVIKDVLLTYILNSSHIKFSIIFPYFTI